MKKWIFLISSFYFQTFSFCQNNDNSFENFWIVFRNAVLENDFQELDSLTDFPLIIKGTLDSDSAREIRHNKFKFVFEVYLKQPNADDSGTDLDEIRKKKMISEKDYRSSNNYIRISDMVFGRVKGNWKLIMIYIDTEDQTKNNIH